MSDPGSKLPSQTAQPGEDGRLARAARVQDLRVRASIARTTGSHKAVASGSFETVPGTGNHTAPGAGPASWRPSSRLEAVERYDRFEILGRIGRGGMAEILLARERSPTGASRHLVIKRVLPEVRDFDELLHMFLDEARVVMGLSHPNLCQIYEVGEHQGAWFIAMEWVNGVTLHQLLRCALETAQVDYGVIARVIAQTADALHYAHTARDDEGQLMQLVHRDVSPHNVMVAFDGRVKLLDFGIAKSSATTHKTEAGVVKGKICYMAPEQWLSQDLDGRTDVFALGACLFEALCGRVVFKRENESDVMRAALNGDVPRLLELAPKTPPALAEIAHRALATKPAHRYQSAREMSEALERFLTSLPNPISSARIAEYTRRLFANEVRLGPMLERSLRGAQLAPNEGMFLPPLPQSLLSGAPPMASGRPLPTPFSWSGPPRGSRPWPEEGALEETPGDQRATIRPGPNRAKARAENGRSLPEVALSSSQAPTQAAPAAATELVPVIAEAPRPLARTLSVRVGRGNRKLAVAGLLALTVLVLIALGVRSLLAPERARRPLVIVGAVHAEPGVGTDPEPAFTLMPPGIPLTESPQEVDQAPAKGQGGRLSINTKPWSRVYLGKRLLGSTPLANVAVPRGTLNLRLVDRDGNVHVRRVSASRQPDRSVHYEF